MGQNTQQEPSLLCIKAVKYKKDIILEIVFFVSSFHCFTKMKENDRNNKVNYLLFQVFMPTFVPDMKKLLYIIVIILFSVTCSRNETNERLIEVDSLVMHQQHSRGDRHLSHSSRHTQVPVPATIVEEVCPMRLMQDFKVPNLDLYLVQ